MPLGGLIIGAAAPIVGGLIKGAAGVGKDTTATTDYQNTTQYDPNAHLYGGYQGGLQDNNANLNYREGLADTRDANTANFSGAQPDYQYAAGSAAMAGADRDAASNVAGIMMQRATGQIPTVAEQQGAVDMRRVAAQQAATAASARGAAGVALAGQTAANNTANAQQGIAGQTQVNAAQERAGYTQSASNAFTGLNSMDANARDAEIARQQYNANLATNQAQFNAQQQQANRDSNDARAMGYEQMQQHANDVALNANLQNQGQMVGSFNGQQTNHAQRGAENAGYENKNWDAMGKSFQSGGSGGGTPVQAAAKGGPITPGQPVLVGEKGPELILPRRPGYVIPNNRLPPTLARGGAAIQRNGLQGMGARDTASMLDDRAFQNERGVPTAGLDAALVAQAERDRQDAAAAAAPGPRMSQAAWEAALTGAPKAYNPNDPAVGLERIAQERGSLRKGGAMPSNDNADADARRGVAPGTADFESTEPKKGGGNAADVVAALDRGRRGFFGGYREGGGPVEPGKAYVAGEKGPEAVVPASRELNAKGDGQGKAADEHAMRGIAQMMLLPGQVPAGLANVGRGIVGSGQAVRSYLQANEQRSREEAATPPVYVEQPPVTRPEVRAAADAKAARLADEQLAREQATAGQKTEPGKLAALYDWLFATSPDVLAQGGGR
jgi:hypothetical protein